MSLCKEIYSVLAGQETATADTIRVLLKSDRKQYKTKAINQCLYGFAAPRCSKKEILFELVDEK